MSIERQRASLEQQENEITNGIAELKRNRGENFSIKQLEKAKKAIRQKIEKLNDQSRKDDVVTFEELGVDRLFIDESHYYKNLYLYTKMRNVGGIAQTEAQKSSDLFMKCRYLMNLQAVEEPYLRPVLRFQTVWWNYTPFNVTYNMTPLQRTNYSILMPGLLLLAKPLPQ